MPNAGSQTLSRGIHMLEIVAANEPLTIAEISEHLGVHRSIGYRILRTLEEHTLLRRDATGRIHPAAGLTELARGVATNLQTASLPVLTEIANELDMSTFITVAEQQDCFTLATVEPSRSHAVTQRPGTRHPLQKGAPGMAMLSQFPHDDVAALGCEPDVLQHLATTSADGYAASHDEVIQGVSSIAVPLAMAGQQPAALAVVYPTHTIDLEPVVQRLIAGAQDIARAMGC